MQPEFPTHKNCANFRNGICMLSGTPVDPYGMACPNFTPKVATTPLPMARTYPKVRQPRPSYPPPPHPGAIHGVPPYIPPPRIRYRSLYPTPAPPVWPKAASASARAGGRGRMGGSGAGGRGRRRGRMGGFAAGPGGFCVCPNCGYKTAHIAGSPCYQQTCPRCGSRMTRGG